MNAKTMTAFLDPPQRRTFELLCDTLAPKLPSDGDDDPRLFTVSAADLNLPDEMEQAVSLLGGASGVRRLARFLNLLESPLANGFMAGHRRSFSQLSLEGRTDVLNAWATSRFAFARRTFATLKRLAMFLLLTVRPGEKENPFWKLLDYPPRLPEQVPGQTPHSALSVISADTSQLLDTDVLIVGSGAAGGVAAAELSAAGLDVLVVEKGAHFPSGEFPTDELTGMRSMYERYGSLSTSDMGLVVLAGSTVGGGTTVNWMTSLEPPQQVLDQWRRQFGFAAAVNGELSDSMAHVRARLSVTTDASCHDAQNEVLERGCRELGYETQVVPRNAAGCRTCDFCGFGCRFGAKQDTRQTFLADACQAGAKILPQARVERILHRQGRAIGAKLMVQTSGGEQRAIEVRAAAVVLAAGAIHTPALLLRSGINSPNIGANLHLHPTTAAYARYSEPVRSWQGVLQSRVCQQFADLDGNGYGVRLEVAPAHPGLWSMALPWQSPRGHRRLVQQLPYLGNIIVLTRDRHTGRIRVDRSGEPVIDYSLHPYDAQHMVRGTIEALRIQRAAGATVVFSPHHRNQAFSSADDAEFEQFLERVGRQKISKHAYGLFSAHQMSSCRLSGNHKTGAVRPDGRLYDMERLFVVDASAMPSACGVNPMITIMGLAHFLSQQIKEQLGK